MTTRLNPATYRGTGDIESPATPAGRDPGSGRFVAGNAAALKHGKRSAVALAAREQAAREALVEQCQAIVADLGGDLSRLAADLVEAYVAAKAMLRWMEDRLLAEGVVTAKGRKRSLHAAYLGQLDRVARLAALLGLERRSRRVASVAEHVARAAAAARERTAAVTDPTPPVGAGGLPVAREGAPPASFKPAHSEIADSTPHVDDDDEESSA